MIYTLATLAAIVAVANAGLFIADGEQQVYFFLLQTSTSSLKKILLF